jgi:uncharacterized membrane protein YqjE
MTTNGMPPPDGADKSLGEIVADVSEKASQLVREEIELAKAEVKDKVSKLTRGAFVAAAAGVFLVFGVTMFFHGLAWFLDDVFNWEDNVWAGFAVVTGEARRTRAELEAQKAGRDQVHRSLERGEEVRR